MHFKSTIVAAAGLISALPTPDKQGLPFVGELAGGSGGSGLPMVDKLVGGGGPGLSFIRSATDGGSSHVQEYNSPPNQPYDYSTASNGNGGTFDGIFKRDDQAKQYTQTTQHTDCVDQCAQYCRQYFQDEDQESRCEDQCPQQCSQALTSPLGQNEPGQDGQPGGQWQQNWNNHNNDNRFPNTGFQNTASPQSGMPANNNQGQHLADPVSQPFSSNGLPSNQGGHGIASPITNTFPGNNNNNGFSQTGNSQENGLADPASQAFCNIFDGLHGTNDISSQQPASRPQGYGASNANSGQSQCPLLQGGESQNGQSGQWQTPQNQ